MVNKRSNIFRITQIYHQTRSYALKSSPILRFYITLNLTFTMESSNVVTVKSIF